MTRKQSDARQEPDLREIPGPRQIAGLPRRARVGAPIDRERIAGHDESVLWVDEVKRLRGGPDLSRLAGQDLLPVLRAIDRPEDPVRAGREVAWRDLHGPTERHVHELVPG